jgi:4,5-dihydroxyphthalate decarboxylase
VTLALSAGLTLNERTRPILEGDVHAAGITLTATAQPTAELFWRQLKYADFDVSELSISSLIIGAAHGPLPWVALPVFTTRGFFHTRIVVRSGAAIHSAADLRGRRVGVNEYQQTSAVWCRGVLQDEFRVDWRDIAWSMEREPERSHGGATGFVPPEGLRFSYVPSDTDIGALLRSGELDATLNYYVAPDLVERTATRLTGADVRPLFPDAAAEKARYFASTGIQHLNHCVVVRRALIERHPWIALELFKAFDTAKRFATDRMRAVSEPYFDIAYLDGAAKQALARDPLPYGIKASERALDAITGYVHEQGLTSRRVALDELFAASTLDL